MPITVNCTDGKIKIGGNFQSALAKVKAVKGRSYDPATKEWTVPAPMKSFDMCGHPIDILSGNGSNRFQAGNHQTAYGNVYSQDEWQMDREADKAASKIDFSEQFEKLNQRYFKQLEALNIPPQHINAILQASFADQVERGAIKFQSKDREQNIMNSWEVWINDYGQLCMDEDDAREAAREAVYEIYGFE